MKDLKPVHREAPDSQFVNVNQLITNKYNTQKINFKLSKPSEVGTLLQNRYKNSNLIQTNEKDLEKLLNSNCLSANNMTPLKE